MSDTEELIAEVEDLFNAGWCLCRTATLGDRVLDALKAAESALVVAKADAWDDGYETRLGDEFDNGGVNNDRTPNPYRTTS